MTFEDIEVYLLSSEGRKASDTDIKRASPGVFSNSSRRDFDLRESLVRPTRSGRSLIHILPPTPKYHLLIAHAIIEAMSIGGLRGLALSLVSFKTPRNGCQSEYILRFG
jgi:hypothetical protein